MIIYDGIKYVDKVPFICFVNENKQRVEVPTDELTVRRISSYLSRIGQVAVRENVEVDESDESSADELQG